MFPSVRLKKARPSRTAPAGPERMRRTVEAGDFAARGIQPFGAPMRLAAWGGGRRGKSSDVAVAGRRGGLTAAQQPRGSCWQKRRPAVCADCRKRNETHGGRRSCIVTRQGLDVCAPQLSSMALSALRVSRAPPRTRDGLAGAVPKWRDPPAEAHPAPWMWLQADSTKAPDASKPSNDRGAFVTGRYPLHFERTSPMQR